MSRGRRTFAHNKRDEGEDIELGNRSEAIGVLVGGA